MFFSKQRLGLVLAIVFLGWSSVDASSSEADEVTYLRNVKRRRLPSKPKENSKIVAAGKLKGAAAKKKRMVKKMSGSMKTMKRKNLFAATLTSTSTGSSTSSKGMSKGKSRGMSMGTSKGTSMGKTSNKSNNQKPLNLLVPSPTMPPVKVRPDMDDWIAGCPTESTAVDGCVTLVTTSSNPTNCKMCLKGLASFNNPPPPSDNGVRLCAEGPTCGMCTVDDVRPFYACGLRVDGDFVVEGRLDGNSTNTTNGTNATAANATAAPVVTQPPTTVDEYNCPALWPGDGMLCVMLDGFDAKRCVYPEFGLDSICKCFSTASPAHPTPLTWKCTNGPVSLFVESGETSPGSSVGNLVGGGTLVDSGSSGSTATTTTTTTITYEDGTTTTSSATSDGTGGSSTPPVQAMPQPIAQIDAVINSLP